MTMTFTFTYHLPVSYKPSHDPYTRRKEGSCKSLGSEKRVETDGHDRSIYAVGKMHVQRKPHSCSLLHHFEMENDYKTHRPQK